jgi:hypothetical protein
LLESYNISYSGAVTNSRLPFLRYPLDVPNELYPANKELLKKGQIFQAVKIILVEYGIYIIDGRELGDRVGTGDADRI